MPKPKKPKKGQAGVTSQKRSRDRRIIFVDQTSLRSEAASACTRVMTRIEKVRAEWMRFENEDVPAFNRWMAGAFGTLMTRARELEQLIREKEYLAQEVETEIFVTGLQPHIAYQRVMRRHMNPEPEPYEAGPDHGSNSSRSNPEEPDETDMELMFEELLETMLDIDPAKMDDETYEEMFRNFKRKVFGKNASDPSHSSPWDEPAPARKPEQARIKEIYRILVRRLHPDLRSDKRTAVSSIWHEVQEAYKAGDLARLETLLALTDMQSNMAGDHTSLFQMRAVLSELMRDLKALQKSLRSAKKEKAWNFARSKDRPAMKARIRGELEKSLGEQEQHLRELEALINHWSEPRGGNARKAPPVFRTQEFSF